MTAFCCPVCGEVLAPTASGCACPNRHSFDTARSGYLNLLLSSSAHAHGDDKTMLRGRRAFLEKDYYRPLLEEICRVLEKELPAGGVLLDAGCGEGYYAAGIFSHFRKKGRKLTLLGIDIAKAAADMTAKKIPEGQFAVASVYKIPLAENTCDAVLSVFSPNAAAEYRRVLKPGGVLVRVYPLSNHLYSLKKAVYESPYRNEEAGRIEEGFVEEAVLEVKNKILLSSPEDICNLFAMTPYFHKTSEADRAKLLALSELETEAEFGISLCRKV